jgi:MYXO-CTERM domain-containing protein
VPFDRASRPGDNPDVRAVVVFLFPLAVLASCASQRPESVATSRQPVINGTADTTHAAVVSIETSLDATTAGELCSGTLIAPRVVLTAGHCTIGQNASSLIVGVGPNAQYPASTLDVAAVVTYPGFTGTTEDIGAGLDLGAILLATDAENADDAGVTPMPLAPPGTGTSVGSTLTVVGYGYSDASDPGSRGMRREGAVAVSASCSALVAFGDATSNACHGDSGGALLARAADGTESLVGVVSFGDDLHCATPSYAVRIDRYAAWIDALIAASDDAGSCAGCPPRAIDCAAIEDAGGAGGEDAEVSSPDAGDAGAGDVARAASSGGCACSTRAAPSLAQSGLFVLVVLGLATRRRRPRCARARQG